LCLSSALLDGGDDDGNCESSSFLARRSRRAEVGNIT
jgi:hypothetical protein